MPLADEVIEAALKGYPNYRFVTAPQKLFEGVSALGTPVAYHGYIPPMITEAE